jgi:hypothetical protein
MALAAGSTDNQSERDVQTARQNPQRVPTRLQIPSGASIAVGLAFGIAVWCLIAFIGFELYQYLYQYLS